LGALTIAGKYLNPLPAAKAPAYHQDASTILEGQSTSNDGAGWLYNNRAADPNLGSVYVNCTHTDTKGSVWTTY
jgi:hypothetical protein